MRVIEGSRRLGCVVSTRRRDAAILMAIMIAAGEAGMLERGLQESWWRGDVVALRRRGRRGVV